VVRVRSGFFFFGGGAPIVKLLSFKKKRGEQNLGKMGAQNPHAPPPLRQTIKVGFCRFFLLRGGGAPTGGPLPFSGDLSGGGGKREPPPKPQFKKIIFPGFFFSKFTLLSKGGFLVFPSFFGNFRAEKGKSLWNGR